MALSFAACIRSAMSRSFACSSSEPRSLLELLGLAPGAPREQIRSRYLRAAMKTHPDTSRSPFAAAQMAELQHAWEQYKTSERYRRSRSSAAAAAPARTGFTAFGVGCSFSDTPEEQAARSVLMEQAARGRLHQRRLGRTASKCGATTPLQASTRPASLETEPN